MALHPDSCLHRKHSLCRVSDHCPQACAGQHVYIAEEDQLSPRRQQRHIPKSVHLQRHDRQSPLACMYALDCAGNADLPRNAKHQGTTAHGVLHCHGSVLHALRQDGDVQLTGLRGFKPACIDQCTMSHSALRDGHGCSLHLGCGACEGHTQCLHQQVLPLDISILPQQPYP